jgi:hypothetical protein
MNKLKIRVNGEFKQIPISAFENDSNFVDEAYVKKEITNAQLGGDSGGIDLSDYATKDDLNNKVDKVEGKSLIDDAEILRLANVTNYDDSGIKNELKNKANKTDIPAIPTKLSELENDSGFITEHQDLSDYAKKTDLPNIDGLATEEYVDSAISNITSSEIPRIEKTSSDTLVSLEPNKLYIFPEMTSLEITLGGIVDNSIVQEYKFRFVSGTSATTLTLPESVKGELTIEANKIYEVSIVDNLLLSQSWVVS